MNRRDFLKAAGAAVAGLVALVLPKGKAEAESVAEWSLCNADGKCIGGRDARIEWATDDGERSQAVTYADVDALFNRPVVYVDGFGGFDEYDGPFYDWTKGNAWDKVELETHSTVGPMFTTDDLLADWGARHWLPEG